MATHFSGQPVFSNRPVVPVHAGSGLAAVALGHVQMWAASDPDGTDYEPLHCIYGDNTFKPIRGFGGWGQTTRRRMRSLSSFGGQDTPALQGDLVMEDVVVSGAVTDKWRALERLAGAFDGPHAVPPPLRFLGNVPHDYSTDPASQWVIETIDQPDMVYIDGVLRRATATVTLAHYDTASLPGVVAAAKGFPRHTLHRGETLEQFARKWLGKAGRWSDVADLNRDNARCPKTPHFKATADVALRTPPRE